MIRTTDIHSLTDFQRNAKTYIRQITETKRPIAVTVNGEAQVVVLDAASYQQMVDELEQERSSKAVRAGEHHVDDGRARSDNEVIAKIKAKHGL
jgi:prevent-host-death family protein